AASGLEAQEAGVDEFLLQDRGGEARVAKISVEHRLRDGKIDVVADQVHQLEGAHAKTPAIAQYGVDGGRVGALLLQQAQRLGVERAGDAVDDEAGGRFRVHRVLAPVGRSGVDG